MAILNSLPTKLKTATPYSNGLMTAEDKAAINKINRIEQDVANKLNITDKIKSNQLDTSSNEYKIQPDNLSDEVIAMISGTTPVSPIYTDKSLVTEYYADNSVTFDKRTPLGSIAVLASESFCNFNTIGNEVYLEIPKNYTIYFGNKSLTFTDTPETIKIVKGSPSIIAYNESEGFSAYGESIHEQDYILGLFDGTNVSMFNGRYTVDGSIILGDNNVHGSIIKNFSLDSSKLAISHGYILADENTGICINVNFTSNFVEAVQAFDINVAEQYSVSVRLGQTCTIPTKDINNDYLHIYYDLGNRVLVAKWSDTNSIGNTLLINNEKYVLIGTVNSESAVGLNSDFISVNSISTRNKLINYTDILNGQIVIDLQNKTIKANNTRILVDNITCTINDTIRLTDDIVTNIINGKPYTLAATKADFNSSDYNLVFVSTDNIKRIGLDAIILASIVDNILYHNKDYIMMIRQDGNVIKSDNIITSGYTLPIDNETVVVKLVSTITNGNLVLISTTVPGTSIIDPMDNIRYDITSENTYQTVIENLHGLYAILFNTQTSKIEVLPQSNIIEKRNYISLGFVNELSDSMSYTAVGHILEHITLNSIRPSNYKSDFTVDPDKGYDWLGNRLVLPDDIYLLPNTLYTLNCQNMSTSRYVDNDYIKYELALPNASLTTEDTLNINIPFTGIYDTLLTGKFKGNNSCLYKNITMHINNPDPKPITVLCIGDDTVDLNMPAYINKYLSSYGYTPTMLGTVENYVSVNGYGLRGLQKANGEGHRGWRITDFVGKTKRNNGTTYYIENNPFLNDNKQFDFSNYMNTQSYDKVDVVVISVGLNDITGNHPVASIEDIKSLSFDEIMTNIPLMYKEIITSIQSYDNSIKIIINPTMINGIDDIFNKNSLLLTETLLNELSTMQNVYFVPGYLSQPLFANINARSIENYETASDINNTKIGPSINTTNINGMAQSNLAFMITSAIIGIID